MVKLVISTILIILAYHDRGTFAVGGEWLAITMLYGAKPLMNYLRKE